MIPEKNGPPLQLPGPPRPPSSVPLLPPAPDSVGPICKNWSSPAILYQYQDTVISWHASP
jgi:hypothetical protein